MEERKKAFPNFKFEDKLVTGNDKARCTVMVTKNIQHKRVEKYEDLLNSTVAIKVIKNSNQRWFHIMAIYRRI